MLHLYADFHVICSFPKEDAIRNRKPKENTEGFFRLAVAFISSSLFILLETIFLHAMLMYGSFFTAKWLHSGPGLRCWRFSTSKCLYFYYHGSATGASEHAKIKRMCLYHIRKQILEIKCRYVIN